MKKVLAMLLCLVLSCGMLVSCADETIGDYLPNYDYKPEVIEDLSLNLYIITEDETVKNAKDTVAQMINAYTTTELHTRLGVYYVSASEYNATVNAAISSTGNDSANIILVNSAEMMNSLVTGGKLANLSEYLSSDKYDYGKLNVQLPKALIEGSKINGELYSIPNNHIIGQYEYLVVDKEVAIQVLKTEPSVVASYKSMQDSAVAELINKMQLAGYSDYSNYIYTCTGSYELKGELEAAGKVCNVIKYPTVTKDVAFSSAFAIVNREAKLNDRAMEVIYAINTDTYLRNLLQYGVEGTNYTVDDNGDIIRKKDTENLYSMNLLYTGDLFKAMYCSELGWIKSVYENGNNQNKEAQIS